MSENIKTSPNPDTRKNWTISVEITQPVYVKMQLVPDRLIAEHSSMKNQITAILNQNWLNPEEMVLHIIETFNNELVPKWIEVLYQHEGISIQIDDRQPGLTNFKSAIK
ncbi:MAG: hypothetical protein JKY84_04240 [Emcibacteraceae bacterium]|nr:hypothetical protein [Emcibacteraceae bacterium]